MFNIVMSSYSTLSLIRMKYQSLFLLITFSLKSALSDVRRAEPASSLIPLDLSNFVHSFALKQCLSLSV